MPTSNPEGSRIDPSSSGTFVRFNLYREPVREGPQILEALEPSTTGTREPGRSPTMPRSSEIVQQSLTDAHGDRALGPEVERDP